MSSADFFAASKILVVAGKGGVGKTTVGSALAVAAASGGCHVMLIALEGYSGLGLTFGLDNLGLEPQPVARNIVATARANHHGHDTADRSEDLRWDFADWGRLDVMQLRPDDALADYLGRAGLGPVVQRFTKTSAVEVVATAAPGIRDLVTLGKVRQLEEAGAADLIIVDAPASGHALSFLTSPAAMANSADSGPIRDQADQVLAMLADEARCQVLLVTLPEETPVTETVETAYAIEDLVGVQLGPLVVNGLWPDIPGLAEAVDLKSNLAEQRSARFRLERQESQRAQTVRLGAELPLPTLITPYLFQPGLHLGGVVSLAEVLDQQAANLAGNRQTGHLPDEVTFAQAARTATESESKSDTEPDDPPGGVPDAPVVLCLGPGGVGKTTVSAAIAMTLAARGQRVVVLTIDPARRLADALGMTQHSDADQSESAELTNEPTLVTQFGSGELWATMLDPAETFEQVVRAEASSSGQAERILGNRLFKNLAHSLSGTNEYMAVERLHQLNQDERFDVVVVDTPPSRHAVDFLDSPGRLTRFVDHRLYRSVFSPGNAVLKGVSAGGQLLLRVLGRMVGAGLVDDVVAFFAEFQGLDDGFRRRADELRQVLNDDAAVVAVVSPRREPLTELSWIIERVSERIRPLDLLVVNRATPTPGIDTGSSDDGPPSQQPLRQNLRQLGNLASAERQLVRQSITSAQQAGAKPVPTRWLDERSVPVRDLEGLTQLAEDLAD